LFCDHKITEIEFVSVFMVAKITNKIYFLKFVTLLINCAFFQILISALSFENYDIFKNSLLLAIGFLVITINHI